MRVAAHLFLLGLCTCAGAPGPQPQGATPGADPLDVFLRPSQFGRMQISPTGEYLGVTLPREDHTALAVLRITDMTAIAGIGFERGQHVHRIVWVGDERLVFSRAVTHGALDHPVSYGDLHAADADGASARVLFGYGAADDKWFNTRLKKTKAMRAWGSVIDPVVEDPEKVVVLATPWDKPESTAPTVYRIHTRTGRKTRVIGGPAPGARVLMDHAGDPRFAWAVDREALMRVWYRDGVGDAWIPLPEWSQRLGASGHVKPLGFSSDNGSVLATERTDMGTEALIRFRLADRTKSEIFQHERVDIDRVWHGFGDERDQIVAVGVEPQRPEIHLIAPESASARTIRGLQKAFPNHRLSLSSMTHDGTQAVFFVSSDRNPGTFYLFDVTRKQVRHLADARPWIDPDAMAPMQPATMKARDGHEIPIYLTLPPGAPSPPPLIVLVHGGPHARDRLSFDSEVQLLAHHGYAVLQVNFRGSSGYGGGFETAGYGEWGGLMQNDVTDATRWALESGKVDAERVCIYGASYGGYAAVMGVIRERDLYRCAVGYAGVYDLTLETKVGDIIEWRAGKAFLGRSRGTDTRALRAASPAHNVAAIDVPLLIVHGGEDRRAPIEHAEALRAALDAAGKDYEWLVMPNEGHGFYELENRRVLYRRMLGFFAEHLRITAPK